MSRDDQRQLDKTTIESMLRDLGAKLQAKGMQGNICITGGAAVALTLNDQRVTQDVDALVLDHPEAFQQAAVEVAQDYGIEPDWAADDISGFIADNPAGQEAEIIYPGLNVYAASPEHLLAMKVRAAAGRGHAKDFPDIVTLAEEVGTTHPDEIAALTAHQFQGIYDERLSIEEYRSAADEAFLIHNVQQSKEDPLEHQQQPARTYEEIGAMLEARTAGMESSSGGQFER